MRSAFVALLDHINIHIQDTEVIHTHCYLLDNHTLCHIYHQDTDRDSANICAMAGIARYSFSPVSYWYSSDYSHWEPLVITSWYWYLKAITLILLLESNHLDTDTLLSTGRRTPPPQQNRRWHPAKVSLICLSFFFFTSLTSLTLHVVFSTEISNYAWRKMFHRNTSRNLVCCLALPLPTLSDVPVADADSLKKGNPES